MGMDRAGKYNNEQCITVKRKRVLWKIAGDRDLRASLLFMYVAESR